MRNDSVERLVTTHFAALTVQPFTYGQRTYLPTPLCVSPLLFRELKCNPNCGGCCRTCTLDFLPSEPHPYKLIPRNITVNGKDYQVFSELQEKNGDHYCMHLDKSNGLCKIHDTFPFGCDFEWLKFYMSHEGRQNRFLNGYYGRAHNIQRVDGGKGAACSATQQTLSNSEIVRKLDRLAAWCAYFEISTVLPEIVAWVNAGPHETPLYVNQQFKVEKRRIGLPIIQSYNSPIVSTQEPVAVPRVRKVILVDS